ncbi:MAG: ABC transporter substrate-binding protein, partial [Pseudomonadota bacterium]
MPKQIVALLLLALLGACSDPPDPPLRVGTNVWPGYEPLYLARDLNFFNAQQVRLVEYPNASEVLRSFRNDAIEVAAVTLDEALLLHDHTPDIRIILGLDYSNGGDALLAQPGIRTLAELKGRRVGVENTALGAYMLSLALESIGMFSSEVQIVPLTVDAHETAFKNKTVDA